METSLAIPAVASQRWSALKAVVIHTLTSTHSRRAYNAALDEFLIWFLSEPNRSLCRATLHCYKAELDLKGLSASTVNLRLSAIRRFVSEAAENALLPREVADSIARVKGPRRLGRRTGRWLSAEQAQALITSPPAHTIRGRRDRAILALLIGTGLRRHELADLQSEQLCRRDARWIIADLKGKGGRVRTVPVADWVMRFVRDWIATAPVADGSLFRSVRKDGAIGSRSMSAQAIMIVVAGWSGAIGLRVAPHDLRRTFAHLAHQAGTPIEQIQFSLGHSSVATTELYLGARQDLRTAPSDRIALF